MQSSLEKDIRELHHIYTILKKYSDNELAIQKANSEMCATLIAEKNALKIKLDELNQECYKLAMYKTELQFIKNNIRYYFSLIQDKTTRDPLFANNKLNELNEQYKTIEAELFSGFKALKPEFISDDQPYPVIIKSILEDKDIDILIDVINHYYLNKTGQLNATECIRHGIRYTEKDGKYPKGLFNGMLSAS